MPTGDRCEASNACGVGRLAGPRAESAAHRDRAVFFDWGDTVMANLPQYSGPMVTWPEVEVVPGVREALSQLRVQYQIVLVTNAGASNAELVRQALARVELAQYFDLIVTSRDLGVEKPDPEFFSRALAMAGRQACDSTIVGDSYENDIRGGKAAGMATVWYNPRALTCPDVVRGLPPLYDAVLQDMIDLPRVLSEKDRRRPIPAPTITGPVVSRHGA